MFCYFHVHIDNDTGLSTHASTAWTTKGTVVIRQSTCTQTQYTVVFWDSTILEGTSLYHGAISGCII